VPAICSVRVVEVGQRFASAGQIWSGRELIAETDPVPFGFDGAARLAAAKLAATLDVVI
jgi:hypothetical protein